MVNKQVQIIGITGGKGGTGKTLVAAALACELAKNFKTLLVDADVDCPNDHLLLSIAREIKQNIRQRVPKWDFAKCNQCGLCGTVCKTKAIAAIKNKRPIFTSEQCNGCGACVLKCPQNAIGWTEKQIGKIYQGKNYNVELLSGELKINEPVSEFVVNELKKQIKKIKKNYDYIIIDTAAGIHCPVIAALEMCGQAFAVTEPTPLGQHDLKLILQLLKKLNIKARIILNRSDIGDKSIIYDLAAKMQAEIAAEIPYSKNIAKKYAEGKPIQDENIKKIIGIF
ncbi:MAG: ATP-binding protein [Patescibacteria group bacterium]|nr:ATP-binding protein [Patescibacteria group bacterium]